MKFIEGNWYLFRINKVITIPEKGDFFVIVHDSGRKLLLNSSYYDNYNYQIGQEIKCRIDKVNCTGQIFLEPEHPVYKEGEYYDFEVLNSTNCNENLFIIEVLDVFTTSIQVIAKIPDNINVGSKIRFKVIRVKKGKPILDLYDNKLSIREIINLKIEDQIVDFNVLKCVELNNEEFFLLSYGVYQSILKKQHYQHYNIQVGKPIKCHVLDVKPNGLLKVEPLNPWYIIGENYSFSIAGIEQVDDLEDNIKSNAIVFDRQGNKCGVIIPNELVSKAAGMKIRCKVLGFKKGRPMLKFEGFEN